MTEPTTAAPPQVTNEMVTIAGAWLKHRADEAWIRMEYLDAWNIDHWEYEARLLLETLSAAARPLAPSDGLDALIAACEAKGVTNYDITYRNGRYIVFISGEGLDESGNGETLLAGLREALEEGAME